MNKMLMYDQYDETYREVIDVKELREYILKRIEELEKKEKEKLKGTKGQDRYLIKQEYMYKRNILQSFLKDLEVEDD